MAWVVPGPYANGLNKIEEPIRAEGICNYKNRVRNLLKLDDGLLMPRFKYIDRMHFSHPDNAQ